MRRLAGVLCLALLCLSACTATFETNAPMSGFSFSHSGMHTGLMYTLSAANTDAGWQAQISLLGGEREHVLEMMEADVERLAAIAVEHHLQAWSGFDKSDPRCLDGTGFRLRIDYADGKHMYAEGSNAFPKGYAAAKDDILDYFAELMEKNGIENPF